MTIDFYYMPASGPCRTVLLAAKAIGVDLNLKLINLMAGEHLKPEFLKVKFLSPYVQFLYVEHTSPGSHTEDVKIHPVRTVGRTVEIWIWLELILETALLIIKHTEFA
jgi:hypothetical protein